MFRPKVGIMCGAMEAHVSGDKPNLCAGDGLAWRRECNWGALVVYGLVKEVR